MKRIALFFQFWLALVFVCVFFVAPLYALAIYPEYPLSKIQVLRGLTSGQEIVATKGTASLAGLLMRLIYCGSIVGLGLLIVWKWLRELGKERKSGTAHARWRRSRHAR